MDDHIKWFLDLSEADFLELCHRWNNKNLDLKMPKEADYDGWLNYFKTITPNKLLALMKLGKDSLSIEAYAALSRWHEIVANPSKIEKIYKAKMGRNQDEIMEIAIGDDDEAFYMALIQQNTLQLNSSSVSQQEVARLTSNINIFRKELRLIRSRSVKKGTTLERVLNAAKSSTQGTLEGKKDHKKKAVNETRQPKAKN